MGTTTALPSLASVRIVSRASSRWLTHGTIVLADVIGLSLAGAVAATAMHLFHAQVLQTDYNGLVGGLFILLSLFAICGLYPGVPTCSINEFRLVLRASSIGFPFLILAPILLRGGALESRSVFFLAWLPTMLLVPLCRRLMRETCCHQPWWGIPTVIVGEPTACQMMLELLNDKRSVGLRPIAVLVERNMDGTHLARATPGVLWGDISEAKAIAQKNRDCYAVLAMPKADSAGTKSVFNEHAEHFRNILIIPDLFGMRTLSVATKDICGVLAIQVDQKLTFRVPRLVKRCFDITVALTVALLVAPIVVLICMAILLMSPGPILYGQSRIGRNRRPFTLWKFRSMIVNAENVLQSHLAGNPELRVEWERDRKLKRDPRVTWIGNLLRKTSLDELPQLWNVIRGDMSLVGPRPIVTAEIERYGDIFRQYERVAPGVTGLWQISGRNNTTFDVRTAIDDYYVRNWSLSLDVYILVRTVKTILLSEGAY